ncbi:hypothetical protein [Streptomyces sp. TLI_171]|uniref:hypothetical protein n=1 Tax=Streptomyces sp. TLI_171 TaxID=1938859 RepID=UPI000C17793D|nr:hypothetical protein [Streptomyces sp. TLI_171]RKE23047.1 hypothetical protein BX266_6503 [Streptomyces sp. TLI_171]
MPTPENPDLERDPAKDRAAGSTPKEAVRERSAEERSITSPTPADVRAKAEEHGAPEPPAADSQAP